MATLAGTLEPVRSYGFGGRMPIREAAIGAIQTVLSAQLSPIVVERNRREMVNPDECPLIVVREASHQEIEDDAHGVTLLRVQTIVEGYCVAPAGATVPDAQLAAAVNLLHARCVGALTGYEIPIASEGMWISGLSLDPEPALLDVSATAIGGFAWTITYDLRAPSLGGPFVT